MMFDLAKALVPCVIVILVMQAFSMLYANVWIVFLLFPAAVTPFTYVISFLFTTEQLG